MHLVQSLLSFVLIMTTTQPSEVIEWKPAQELAIEGRGWLNPDAPFTRLPAKMQQRVRPELWSYSRHSAGISVHFQTSVNQLSVRWKLTSKDLAMKHTPSTAVSGVDLYVRDGSNWRFVHNYQPSSDENSGTAELNNPQSQQREYFLYLPLYNGVESLDLSPAAQLEPVHRDATEKPIVVYGTSIGQGACASRPGMAWPTIVGRQLNREVINLSFAGQAQLDPEVAEVMDELDPAAIVLDPLWNMNYMEPSMIIDRAHKFIQILRASHPETPIVMIGESNFRPEAHPTPSTLAFRGVFDDLVKAGDTHLYWIDGKNLLGDDGEATVDGIHPSDVGMQRQAAIVTDALQKILR